MQAQESDLVRLRRIEALGKLNNDNPVWIELKDLLNEEIDYSIDLALRVETKTEEVHWHRGYAQASRNILRALEGYRNANRTIANPEEES